MVTFFIKRAHCLCDRSIRNVTVAVYMFQATRADVALINLIYGSHFSATEATYEVSQNKKKIAESLYIYI